MNAFISSFSGTLGFASAIGIIALLILIIINNVFKNKENKFKLLDYFKDKNRNLNFPSKRQINKFCASCWELLIIIIVLNIVLSFLYTLGIGSTSEVKISMQWLFFTPKMFKYICYAFMLSIIGANITD